MRIALISDTHLPGEVRNLGQLGPKVEELLTSVDLILHGGDILSPTVLDWLEQYAPVLAARGNNDGFGDDPRVKPIQYLDLDGLRLGMRHDLEEYEPPEYLRERYFHGEHVDIMVCGHTHYEHLEYRDNVLFMNSGSPIMPHNYGTRLGMAGLLEIKNGEVRAEIMSLGETEGKRNPGVESGLVLRDGQIIDDRTVPITFKAPI